MRSTLAFILLTLCCGHCLGQQAGPSAKVPSLSSDDVPERQTPALDLTETLAPPKPALGFPTGWAVYSPGECGFSISLPKAPQEKDFEVPEELKEKVIAERSYLSNDNKMGIVAAHFITIADIPGGKAAVAFLDRMAKSGFENMKYTIEPGTVSRIPIRAAFDQDGLPFSLEGFVQVGGKDTWIITAIYESDNTKAMMEARRVLASARFELPNSLLMGH
jgi:hypothetical protein